MKKLFVCVPLLFVIAFSSVAQIPPYHVTIFDSSATKGYYFLVPGRMTNPTAGIHSQLVLDRFGDVVYYKSLGAVTNSPDFKVQPNGMITYYKGLKFYILDSTFTIIDSVSCKNSITTDIHEFHILPNGHFLLLGYENITMDLSAYPWFQPAGSYGSNSALVKCNVIQEQDENKNVVFEWHCKDYFSFADVDSVWLSNPFSVDWTHCNALEVDDDGNILLSTRHFNEITKINRSDSSIMWRMGGVRNQFTFLNDSIPFYGQHDIRRLANGNVSLYDNGYRIGTAPYHYSRALEYRLDESALTAELVWDYVYDSTMYSRATGNVQRLPDGNTLLNYGHISKNNFTFVVVDSLKNKIFQLAFDDTMSSYRSFNFQQLPWTFNRPHISCIDSAGNHYLDAGAGYSSYLWNTGDTTQQIPVTYEDTFTVFVPYGNDGFVSAEKFIVTDILHPCGINGIATLEQNNFPEIFPIPATTAVSFNPRTLQGDVKGISLYDLQGKLVKEFNPDETLLDISGIASGVYFLRITTVKNIFNLKVVKN